MLVAQVPRSRGQASGGRNQHARSSAALKTTAAAPPSSVCYTRRTLPPGLAPACRWSRDVHKIALPSRILGSSRDAFLEPNPVSLTVPTTPESPYLPILCSPQRSTAAMSCSKSATITNVPARGESLSSPYVIHMVTVAVLPPRLPPPVTPPASGPTALAFSWDEPLPRRKPWVKRILSSERTGPNPSRPPFIMREVRWSEWRRHYAKDKSGNYKGTHAPAEDCLLLPHDVERWRLGEATTVAHLWTRGKYALPVYGEEKEFEVGLPAYNEKDPLAAAGEGG